MEKKAFHTIVPPEVIDAYRGIGYRISSPSRQEPLMRLRQAKVEDRPLVVSSMMKSGTWLIRKIISELTGLTLHEPISTGDVGEYEDGSKASVPPGTFNSWHFLASDSFRDRITAQGAKVIFLYRNVADVLISLYHHFIKDIDANQGRPTNNSRFFTDMTESEAIAFMITGFNKPPFHWIGSSILFKQMLSMLEFSQTYPIHFISYEDLLMDRNAGIRDLAAFLHYLNEETVIRRISKTSSFSEMKSTALLRGVGGKHFRNGGIGDHIASFTPFHYNLLTTAMYQSSPQLLELLTNRQIYDFLPQELMSQPERPAAETACHLADLLTQTSYVRKRALLYGMNDLCKELLSRHRGLFTKALLTDSYKYPHINSFYACPVIPPSKVTEVAFDIIVICATTAPWPQEVHDDLRKRGLAHPIVLKKLNGLSHSGWTVEAAK